MEPDDRQPVFVTPHSGKVLDFLSVTHKLTSQQTGGACYIFESSFEPGAGNRLHVHSREDEIGYVLTGALEIRLQDRTATLEAGGIARSRGTSRMRSAIRSRHLRGICSSPFQAVSTNGSMPWPTRTAMVCWKTRCFASSPWISGLGGWNSPPLQSSPVRFRDRSKQGDQLLRQVLGQHDRDDVREARRGSGMIEASTTLSRSTPCTRPARVDDVAAVG